MSERPFAEYRDTPLWSAVEAVLASAEVKTPDLGGNAKTADVTHAIVEAFQSA